MAVIVEIVKGGITIPKLPVSGIGVAFRGTTKILEQQEAALKAQMDGRLFGCEYSHTERQRKKGSKYTHVVIVYKSK